MSHKKRWGTATSINTVIHVKMNGLPASIQLSLYHYIEDELRPLKLGLSFIMSLDLSWTGGINLNFTRGVTNSTRFARSTMTDGTLIQVAQCNINMDRIEEFIDDGNRERALCNATLHEFLHALGLDHILYLPDKMPKPLMGMIFGKKSPLSSDKLYFEYADKQALKSLYGKNLKTKKVKFKPEDIDKTCYFIHKEKQRYSFSVTITAEEMQVSGLVSGGYKKVIQ